MRANTISIPIPKKNNKPLQVLFGILIVINVSIFTTLQVCLIDTCAVDKLLSVINRKYLYLLTKLFDKNNCRLMLQLTCENVWLTKKRVNMQLHLQQIRNYN